MFQNLDVKGGNTRPSPTKYFRKKYIKMAFKSGDSCNYYTIKLIQLLSLNP